MALSPLRMESTQESDLLANHNCGRGNGALNSVGCDSDSASSPPRSAEWGMAKGPLVPASALLSNLSHGDVSMSWGYCMDVKTKVRAVGRL